MATSRYKLTVSHSQTGKSGNPAGTISFPPKLPPFRGDWEPGNEGDRTKREQNVKETQVAGLHHIGPAVTRYVATILERPSEDGPATRARLDDEQQAKRDRR